MQSGVKKTITGRTGLKVTVVFNKQATAITFKTIGNNNNVYCIRENNGTFSVEIQPSGTISSPENVMFIQCLTETILEITATF